MPQSRVHKRGSTTPEMNVTPLIDVTFQLIIFFLLVNNIMAEDLPPMIVPDIENPAVDAPDDQMKAVFVNIVPADDAGNRKPDSDYLKGFDGRAGMVKIGLERIPLGPEPDFERITTIVKTEVERATKLGYKSFKVVLRADAGIRYEQVVPVMRAIGKAEVERIELVAYQQEQNFADGE